eukprot:scaffold17227_cov136-Skeletonema_marinoi.AAC.12
MMMTLIMIIMNSKDTYRAVECTIARGCSKKRQEPPIKTFVAPPPTTNHDSLALHDVMPPI